MQTSEQNHSLEERVSELEAQVADLQKKVALLSGQEPETVTVETPEVAVVEEELEHREADPVQLLVGARERSRGLLVARAHLVRHLVDRLVEDGALVPEVLVEQRARDAARLRDHAEVDLRVAQGREEPDALRDDVALAHVVVDLRHRSERVAEGRRDEVRVAVVAAHVALRLVPVVVGRLDVVVLVVHADEVVAEVEAEVLHQLDARAEADDVAVAGGEHRRLARLARGVLVVRVADAAADPVREVVLHADAHADRVAPVQRQVVAVAVADAESDRLDARPARVGDR